MSLQDIIDQSEGRIQMIDATPEHLHAWGPLKQSRLAGTVHRTCQCGTVLATEDAEDYPLALDASEFTETSLAAQMVAFDEALSELDGHDYEV